MRHLTATALALGLATSACQDLSEFDTAPGEAYCGAITLASVYRTGFSPRVQMRLTFDSSKVERSESPGTVTTFDSEADVPQILVEAPLRPIPPLFHDPLSHPEFGDGRERNLIYAVSPNDPTAESMIAVVSLRSDGNVEVRLLRPGAEDQEGVSHSRKQLFGLFSLTRREGDCGF